MFFLNHLLCFTVEWMRRPVKSSQNWAANLLGNWPFETAGSLLEPKECKTRVPLSRYLVQDFGRSPESIEIISEKEGSPHPDLTFALFAAYEKQQKLQQVWGLARSPWDGGLHSAANHRGPVRVRSFETSSEFSHGDGRKSLQSSTYCCLPLLWQLPFFPSPEWPVWQCLNKANQLPFSEKYSCPGLWEERTCKQFLIAGLVLTSLL